MPRWILWCAAACAARAGATGRHGPRLAAVPRGGADREDVSRGGGAEFEDREARITAAVAKCRSALLETPANHGASRCLVALLDAAGRHDEALAVLEAAAARGSVDLAVRAAEVTEERGGDASGLWRTALALDADDARALRGLVEHDLRRGRFRAARREIRQRLKRKCDDETALELAGVERHAAGDAAGARRALVRAAELRPTAASLRRAASACVGAAAHDEAFTLLTAALDLEPYNADVRSDLAVLVERRGDRPLAESLLRGALGAPASAQARCQLARLVGDDDADAPWRRQGLDADYVRGLFSQYSRKFDDKLLNDLAYTGHELVAAALAESMRSEGPTAPAVVDAGCGTGLVGACLRRGVMRDGGALIGIDLSPAMCAAAAKRTHGRPAKPIYDAVVSRDCADYLSSLPRHSVDAVTAADVLIYVGRCDALFAAAAHALRPGTGRLAFTVEATETPGFRLGAGGRFVHSSDYIRSAAQAAGLQVALVREDAALRLQGGQGVKCLTFVLRAAPRDAIIDT